MTDYFEGQKSKDCVIHSLNNAFGRQVVTKPEVLSHIDQVVEMQMQKFAGGGGVAAMSNQELGRREKVIRAKYSSGRTFFAADIVWETAKKSGTYAMHMPIPGFSSPFLRIETLTPEILSRPIVVLGGNHNGGTHAIAIRNGFIYDSERKKDGPRPLTREELGKSLKKVFGAYVFLQSPSEASLVRAVSRNTNIRSFE